MKFGLPSPVVNVKSLLLFPEEPPLPVPLVYLPKGRGGDAEVVESGGEEGW